MLFEDLKTGGKPVMCDAVQPWKNDADPTSEPTPETEEAMLIDLAGCIRSLHYQYSKLCPSYTLEDATSDAYIALRKAIAKDRLAPKITKSVSCPCCSARFKPDCPGDERADHIYNVAPKSRVPQKRVISVNCGSCGHSWKETVYKTKFSTHVWTYIRGEIQSGVRKARNQDISLDCEVGEGTMHDIIPAETKEVSDKLPVELVNEIYSIIEGLPPRHRETALLFFGMGGKSNHKVTRTVRCRCCTTVDEKGKEKPLEWETVVDYSLSTNFSECPECGMEIEVDMKMNQTDIARLFDISKQRIGSIIKKINGKMSDGLDPIMRKHDIII